MGDIWILYISIWYCKNLNKKTNRSPKQYAGEILIRRYCTLWWSRMCTLVWVEKNSRVSHPQDLFICSLIRGDPNRLVNLFMLEPWWIITIFLHRGWQFVLIRCRRCWSGEWSFGWYTYFFIIISPNTILMSWPHHLYSPVGECS